MDFDTFEAGSYDAGVFGSGSSSPSLLDSVKGWADTLGGLAGQYLNYRRVSAQDALQAENARYQLEAAKQGGDSSGWVMPALLIGGGLLVVVMLARR